MRNTAALVALTAVLAASPVWADENADSDRRGALRLDVGIGVFSAVRGDGVFVPVEYETRAWARLTLTFGLAFAAGTGSGVGLYSLGARVALRWYPFSSTPRVGFHVGLRAGGDAVLDIVGPTVFPGLRPAGSVVIGYAFELGNSINLSAGVDVNLIGLGFPVGSIVAPRLAVGIPF